MCKHRVFWFPVFLICSIAFFDTGASRIPLGSKLSVSKHEYWISPDENFAFGFFNRSDQPNRFGVGIRFNSISIPLSEQALVWVAGAHVSVGYDSFLQLDEAGDLVLFDSSEGAAVWRSNTRNSSVSRAGLLDDGNLVLLNIHEDVIWQSFDTPSDTLLPGQNLTSFKMLRAASSNFVSSHYSLFMDASGQLRLSWETNVIYWKTEATSSEPILAAVFTGKGAFQLLDMRSSPVWSRFGDDHNDSSVNFRFLRLDSDGNLRMYSWTGGSDSWRKVWRAVVNQCDVFATCGLSGICAFAPSGDTTCNCPFGGLSSNSSLNCFDQTCDARSTMITLEHTFLYGIYPPEDYITRSSIELCRNSCLQDPRCTSVTVTNDGKAECRMKRTRFITGHEHPSLTSISFVKVCFDPLPAVPGKVHASPPSSSAPSLPKPSSRLHMSSAIVLASGALVAFVVLQIGAFLCFLKRRKAIKSLGAARYPCQGSVGLISLSYSELKDITSDFKHQIGLKLHKGVLPINQVVVVKELKYDSECGENIGEKQFKSWIFALGGIHHKNLVRLLACSCNADRRFLVYEFIKNASVDKWLEDAKLSRRLTWRKRMDICIGVAKALAYLHSGCREFVSHGNLKWGNVLLNEELEAKVTEFGLARVQGNVSQDSQGAEVDVARFGEMIVIMVSGHQGGADACSWAYKEWAEGCAERVVDSRIGGKFDVEEVERMLRVAFWCIQTDARLRPMMGEVLKVLEGTLSVDPPPPPYPCPKPLEESHSIQ